MQNTSNYNEKNVFNRTIYQSYKLLQIGGLVEVNFRKMWQDFVSLLGFYAKPNDEETLEDRLTKRQMQNKNQRK